MLNSWWTNKIIGIYKNSTFIWLFSFSRLPDIQWQVNSCLVGRWFCPQSVSQLLITHYFLGGSKRRNVLINWNNHTQVKFMYLHKSTYHPPLCKSYLQQTFYCCRKLQPISFFMKYFTGVIKLLDEQFSKSSISCSHSRPIRPSVAQSGEQTQTASWMTVTCLKIAGNKAVVVLSWPPHWQPQPGHRRFILRVSRPWQDCKESCYWLINITECQLPQKKQKTHSFFVPTPELIAVVVWLLTRLMFSYLNSALLSLTLPQRLLWHPLTCLIPLAFMNG